MILNHDEALYNEGYDSDGEMPYFDEEADAGEDPDLYIEPSINLKPPLEAAPTLVPVMMSGAPPTQKLMPKDVKNKLSVNELKVELMKRGCKIGGKKGDLQACLLEALKNNIPVSTTDEIDKRNISINGLAPTAFWNNLTQQPEPTSEPATFDLLLRPPTERNEAPPNPNMFSLRPLRAQNSLVRWREWKQRSQGRGTSKLANYLECNQIERVV